jgi:beta-phosphoglucomutase-like phosphatase (HAD superfamily)
MQSSTKGFELIISDCDGVLVDSEPIINRAHTQMLAGATELRTHSVVGAEPVRPTPVQCDSNTIHEGPGVWI